MGRVGAITFIPAASAAGPALLPEAMVPDAVKAEVEEVYAALKSANAPADAVTLGNNESLNGLGGGAVVGATSVPRVYVAGSPVAARSEAERLAEYTQQTQFVGGRSFYQNGNQWIDAAIQKLKDPKRIRVQLNSKEYFDLVARKSEARPWLALGQNVQFVLNGTVYEIYDN